PVPLRDGDVGYVDALLVVAGRGDQEVDPPEPPHDLIDRAGDRCPVRHVGLHWQVGVRRVQVDARGPPAGPPHQPGAAGAAPARRAGADGAGPIRGARRHASSASATPAARLSVPPAGAPRRNVRQTISAPTRPSTAVMMIAPQLRYHSLKTGRGQTRLMISARSQTAATVATTRIERPPHSCSGGDSPRHCL